MFNVNKQTSFAAWFTGIIMTLTASIAMAGPHEVQSCEQDGTSLSGSCIDGSEFDLTCTDGVAPVDCDLSEETAWNICGDQCESNANGYHGVRPSRGVQSGPLHPGPRSTKTRTRRKSKAKAQRTRRGLGRIVARGHESHLAISVGESRTGEDTAVWTYTEGDDSLVFSCVAAGECTITVNGQRVHNEAITARTAQLALGANALLAGLDWEEDIPQDWLDVVCAISLGLAFHPPVGTALGGPTALGCLVMMAMDEI